MYVQSLLAWIIALEYDRKRTRGYICRGLNTLRITARYRTADVLLWRRINVLGRASNDGSCMDILDHG